MRPGWSMVRRKDPDWETSFEPDEAAVSSYIFATIDEPNTYHTTKEHSGGDPGYFGRNERKMKRKGEMGLKRRPMA